VCQVGESCQDMVDPQECPAALTLPLTSAFSQQQQQDCLQQQQQQETICHDVNTKQSIETVSGEKDDQLLETQLKGELIRPNTLDLNRHLQETNIE